MNFTNKNFLVTGAANGNGKAIASKIISLGGNVILIDKDISKLKILKNKFSNSSSSIMLIGLEFKKDLNFLKIIKDFFSNKKIKLNGLVNNAGISLSNNFDSYPYNYWEETIFTNLTVPFLLTQKLSKLFIKSGGSIVNITSLSSKLGFPENPAYVASKGGLAALTRSCALDLSKKNIRVNSVGPGYIKTNMTKGSFNQPQKKFERSKRMISKRWGVPVDVANVVTFLLSDESIYINGQEVFVDGGWLAKGL